MSKIEAIATAKAINRNVRKHRRIGVHDYVATHPQTSEVFGDCCQLITGKCEMPKGYGIPLDTVQRYED